LFPKVHTNLTA
jgi:hypothetical protein